MKHFRTMDPELRGSRRRLLIEAETLDLNCMTGDNLGTDLQFSVTLR